MSSSLPTLTPPPAADTKEVTPQPQAADTVSETKETRQPVTTITVKCKALLEFLVHFGNLVKRMDFQIEEMEPVSKSYKDLEKYSKGVATDTMIDTVDRQELTSALINYRAMVKRVKFSLDELELYSSSYKALEKLLD